jgi:hypothetical protein
MIKITDFQINDGTFLFEKTPKSFKVHHKNHTHPGLTCRLPLFMRLLSNIDIPSFRFCLNLHDEIGLDFQDYIKDNPEIFCFAKKSFLKNPLIYNYDCCSGYLKYALNKVKSSDINYNEKSNSSLFCGQLTGDGNRKKYIELEKSGKNFAINSYNFPMKYQLSHKYLINIDGNSITYSRLYWQIYSNSVPVYLERKDSVDLLLLLLQEYNLLNFYDFTIEEWINTDFENLKNDEEILKNNLIFSSDILDNINFLSYKKLYDSILMTNDY